MVRQRDDYTCQWCLYEGRINKNKKHHAHHIVARSISGTNGAFDVENGVTLCYRCHIDRVKAHHDEYIKFRDAWLARNGTGDYFFLREKFRPIVKFTEDFFSTKMDSLRYVLNNKIWWQWDANKMNEVFNGESKNE